MAATGVHVFRQTSILTAVVMAAAMVAAVPTVRGQSVPELTRESRQKLDALTNLEDAPLGQVANQIAPIVLGPAR